MEKHNVVDSINLVISIQTTQGSWHNILILKKIRLYAVITISKDTYCNCNLLDTVGRVEIFIHYLVFTGHLVDLVDVIES